MPDAPRILIIGAGLGGLCLAQGLRKAGLEVSVYERDASADTRAQGYRISMDNHGTGALRACLPDPLFRLFEATGGQPSLGGSIFASDGQNLKPETTTRFPAGAKPMPGVPEPGRAVDRLVLREILLADLDGLVHFGKAFTHYGSLGNCVEAHFADGTTASGDVLVAADGVGSRVRQQFFPKVSLVDTGMRWLGGKTMLDHRLGSMLPDDVDELVVWIKEHGKLWFLAPVFFQQKPNDVARELSPGLRFTDNDDFMMWALMGQRDGFPFGDEQLLDAPETELHTIALQAVRRSHPLLKALVEEASADRSFSLAVRAVPVVDRWPSSRITFLGDAIHASPVNGTGANAALEDAARLTDHLVRSEMDLQSALDEYETELLDRVRAMRAGLASGSPLWAGMMGNLDALGPRKKWGQ